MSWMLKITEGPMKGAEIALADGMRVKVGSSETCDIVVADSTLSGEAFDLDVAPAAVTLIEPDGKASELLPFEARSFGTTTFAVGPEDGDWTQVTKRAEPPKAAEPAAGEPHAEPRRGEAEKAEGEGPAAGNPSETGEASKPNAPAERKRHGCGCGCLGVILLMLALVILAALFLLLPRVVEEGGNEYVDRVRPYSERTWDVCERFYRSRLKDGGSGRDVPATTAPGAGHSTLADIAREYSLTLATDGPAAVLSGNLARRTERLAIRALALAAEPTVRFDLTDDETLKSAADDLLFACTDGRLKAFAASNRVVALRGYAPDAVALERAVRALDADVPGIDRLDTSRVVVGGPAPEQDAEEVVASDAETPTPVLRKKRPPKRLAPSRPDYPVAGVLTKPYPCVVLRNGMRLCEGAMIETAEIVKIEADKLTLKEGERTFEWVP